MIEVSTRLFDYDENLRYFSADISELERNIEGFPGGNTFILVSHKTGVKVPVKFTNVVREPIDNDIIVWYFAPIENDHDWRVGIFND